MGSAIASNQVSGKSRLPQASSGKQAKSGLLQRQCACGGAAGLDEKCGECQQKEMGVQRLTDGTGSPAVAPTIVHEVLRSPGQPLDAATRADLEPRFGHDFSKVRIHSDSRAAASARAVAAHAYTVGSDLVFGASRYSPRTESGRKLLAHELTHVVQQGGSPGRGGTLAVGPTGDAYERQADAVANEIASQTARASGTESAVRGRDGLPGSLGAPLAVGIRAMSQSVIQRDANGNSSTPAPAPCAQIPGCPADFCTPFATQDEAVQDRAFNSDPVLKDIAMLNSRAVPLFQKFIFGGGSAGDISADFAVDFTNATATLWATHVLVKMLEDAVNANPPTLPPNAYLTLNIDDPTLLSDATINDTLNKNMGFSDYTSVPGLIAGGVPKVAAQTQAACMVGADTSSTQNDARTATGTITVWQAPDGTQSIYPDIEFTVIDTLDFCPGNCGGGIAQRDTVPLSRWEASGISGDVPFTVTFPAPSLTPAPAGSAAPAASTGSAGSEE
jgi:hypothetical protein